MTEGEMDAIIRTAAGGEVTYRDRRIFSAGRSFPFTPNADTIRAMDEAATLLGRAVGASQLIEEMKDG